MNPIIEEKDPPSDAIIEMVSVSQKSQLQANLLPLPQFQRFHSSVQPSKPSALQHHRGSLPEEALQNSGSIVSIEFKVIWLLNQLAKMKLDLNRCYSILEKINLEEEIALDLLLNNILNQYLSEEVTMEEPDNIFAAQAQKASRHRLLKKIFNMSKVDKEKIGKNLEKTTENKLESDFLPAQNPQKQEIQEAQEEALKPEEKICTICYGSYQEDQTLLGMLPHIFCSPCLMTYIQQKVFSNQILQIKCPDDCGHLYSNEQIQLILTSKPEIYQKYLKFKHIAEISQDPDVRWCVRPECEGFMKGGSLTKKITCPICAQDMCFLCRNAWHEGQSCEQAMNSEFKRYAEMVEVKACPKCKSKIEKNQGCNHMICARCHYQFCWLCLGKYGTRHYAWYNVFGCSGMQYTRIKMNWKCFYLLRLLKFVTYLLLAAFAIAVSPLAIIGLAFVFPYSLFFHHCQPKDPKKRKIYKVVFFICVLILLPLEIVLTIVPGICLLVYELLYVVEYD